MFISVGMYVINFSLFVYGAIRASRVIHRQLVQAVLGTTLRYPLASRSIALMDTIQMVRHDSDFQSDH